MLSDPNHGDNVYYLLSHGGSRTTSCPPPSKKGQELGWAGLAVVTLVFSCLQRDLGRREQRAEGGLAGHSEYSVPWSVACPEWYPKWFDNSLHPCLGEGKTPQVSVAPRSSGEP